jgi:hypothetical protein
MTPDARGSEAIDLLTRFARRTGIIHRPRPAPPSRRYLWTDAFAVTTFLELADVTDEPRHRELALQLIEQVHHELGRFREDDDRTGWISGLSEDEGERHPTHGGLRIGKPLPERRPGEEPHTELEWERDGQYFHYLTKWAYALDQTARDLVRPTEHRWARELVAMGRRAFVYGPPGRRRMAWKLSIDGSRALVRSMGQHDPLDGYVTCATLDATADRFGWPRDPDLAEAAADFRAMIDPRALATGDPLGLGGLLFDVARLVQIGQDDLVVPILEGATFGLEQFLSGPDLRAHADERLAFRELGLAIALAPIPRLAASMPESMAIARARMAVFEDAAMLADEITMFWLDPKHRASPTWKAHEDINDVMLATSLVPEGFICLRTERRTPCLTGKHEAP